MVGSGYERATPPLLVRVGRWEGDFRVRSYWGGYWGMVGQSLRDHRQDDGDEEDPYHCRMEDVK